MAVDPSLEFLTNLIRLLCAETWTSLSMSASQQIFGKGYFALSPAEKTMVDQSVLSQIGGNYQAMTPEYLKGADPSPKAGFQPNQNDPSEAASSQTEPSRK